uniref:Uncharacterized protein n=1 Tax=Haemonchus contortus TaxID=6289 RepID=W6N8S7_HAECO
MFPLIILMAVIATVHSQMVRQCTCKEVEQCKRSATGNIMQCADQCQSHIAALGASYQGTKNCLRSQEPLIGATIRCESSLEAGSCAQRPGGKVPKRYPETLKLAAYAEIESQLAKSGIQREAKPFLVAGKKFSSCITSCMDRGGGNCLKKLNCGLALPPDNVLVQQTKQCALRSGLNTPAVQRLCNCLAAAGARGLSPICGKIRIS